MKLQKIKDVRVGQIWTFNGGKTYDLVINVKNIDQNFNECLYEVNYAIFADHDYMIGKKQKQDKSKLFWQDIEYCRKDESASKDILEWFKKPDKYLVGFLGITHKIQNDKLVEIPRKQKFEVDDILYCKFPYLSNNCIKEKRILICYDGVQDLKDYNSIKKVGILGLNCEFVNDKLCK